MSISHRRSPFTFAEIVIGAPWAMTLLAPASDNDKGSLLHRNNTGDEWSGQHILALEKEARLLRATALADGISRLGRRIAAALRPARA